MIDMARLALLKVPEPVLGPGAGKFKIVEIKII